MLCLLGLTDTPENELAFCSLCQQLNVCVYSEKIQLRQHNTRVKNSLSGSALQTLARFSFFNRVVLK